jgi:hypothetical protein
MAKKKKRGFPSKVCPGCGKVIHARKFKCPYCNYDFGLADKYAASAPAAEAAPTAVAEAPARAANAITLEQLKAVGQMVKTIGGFRRLHEMISVIREVGGLRKFKELLEAMEITESSESKP